MAGEIELLDLGTLTHMVGHDVDGLAKRQAVTSLESNLIAVASGTPSAADILNFIESDDTTFRKMTWAALVAAMRSTSTGFPGYVSGRNYIIDQQGTPSNGSNIGTGRTRCFPMRVQQPMSLTELGAHIATGSAGGFLRVGLYNHDSTNRRPGTLVAATGNISTASSGSLTAALLDSAGGTVTSVTIQPGLYWAALRVDNATVVTTGYGANAVGGALIGAAAGTALIGSSAVGQRSLDYTTGYSFAGNFGDLSSTAPDTDGFSNNNALLVGRAA